MVQQLIQFNSHRAGDGNFRQLAVFLRDTQETIVGGLIGSIYWQWLYIDVFWISESHRGGGYGSSLLAAAEQEAIARGCEYSYFWIRLAFRHRNFIRSLVILCLVSYQIFR
ncbi:GNAT family N-acetyltransferase [Leptolyngbya sp. NIES-2104]|uniref:GNAT family N-acetyltransferase n=1 Tax=Leptolyngbya sp. NIES-2104 TaxID=1552121 RepID=UPI00192D0751|nr:GNAT family N-acetyltransferase [Leptolyngbya sp. NIES-2104]